MTDSPIEIRPLTPERLDDFLAYFDHDAFADNPRWASCYCQHLYVDHNQVDWHTRTAEVNRTAACERICSRRMQGYLAYRDGKPVGWCNAAPRLLLDAFNDEPDPDATRLGQITCFVIARAHRRTGVASALLLAACAGLKAEGMSIAEAETRSDANTDAELHNGTLDMFLAAGFEEVRRDDEEHSVWVRRRL